MSGLWEEVKTRKIFKAATIYAAIAWGIIQIADILLPVLGIADWVMSSMVLLAFSGFPVALISGWMLDIKLERRRLLECADDIAQKSSLTTRIAELAIIGTFGIGAAYLYYNSVNEPYLANIVEPKNSQQSVDSKVAQKTIAVLPFVNFGDSTEDEFFADGLSEELLNVLARTKQLRVAARTSSFQYKNTNINVKTIARELGVNYILEGSVRRSGELIRVTAQLIKADEDVHIFSKSWDRNTTNVFKVQDEISQSVLEELKISLLGAAKQQNSDIGTLNISAFAEYSRGLAFLRNRSKTDFDNAIKHFKQALKLDPGYAEAMAMLAETYFLQVSYGLIEFDDAFALGKPQVQKALQLNPELGVAHAVKGLMHWQLANRQSGEQLQIQTNNLDIAKQHFSKAIELNPSLAEAYMWYGSVLQQQGAFADGAKLREKAFEIDPQSAVAGYNRALDLVRYGDYKQAMDVFNTVVRNNPNYANAYSIAGEVSYAVGQLDQAYGMYRRLAQLSEDQTGWLINSSRIFLAIKEFELAQHNIDELKGNNSKEYADKFDWLQASIWLASKDYDSFYKWTKTFKEDTKAWEQRLWRGIASLSQNNAGFAVFDLSQALQLIRNENPQRVDESTLRIQLFLAKANQLLGNQLQANQFLANVTDEINQLNLQGIDNQSIRYQQAALSVLNGQDQQALSLLRQSVREGFVDFWWVEADPIFSEIRRDPAFVVIGDEFNIRMRLIHNSIESQYGKLAILTN